MKRRMLRSSMTAGLLLRAESEVSHERRTDIGTAATTILEQKQNDLAEAPEIRTVDDRAAAALTVHKFRTGQDGEMSREGVLRRRWQPRELPRRKAVRFVRHEKPETLEARGLRKRRKSENGRP